MTPTTGTPTTAHTSANTAVTSSVQVQNQAPSTSASAKATVNAVNIERDYNASATTSSRTAVPSPIDASSSNGKGDNATENGTVIEDDPFQLREGLLSDEQLAGLRSRLRRKGPFGSLGDIVRGDGKGKARALEAYHVRQNNVRVFLLPFLLFFGYVVVFGIRLVWSSYP